MLYRKKGVGTFVAELIAIFLTIVMIIIFNIIFQLTVESRTNRIKSESRLNDLGFQTMAYLRTPYEKGDIADNLMAECMNDGDFTDIRAYTEKLNLPDKLSISLECNNKKADIKEGLCEAERFFEIVSLRERDFIKIIYC